MRKKIGSVTLELFGDDATDQVEFIMNVRFDPTVAPNIDVVRAALKGAGDLCGMATPESSQRGSNEKLALSVLH